MTGTASLVWLPESRCGRCRDGTGSRCRRPGRRRPPQRAVRPGTPRPGARRRSTARPATGWQEVELAVAPAAVRTPRVAAGTAGSCDPSWAQGALGPLLGCGLVGHGVTRRAPGPPDHPPIGWWHAWTPSPRAGSSVVFTVVVTVLGDPRRAGDPGDPRLLRGKRAATLFLATVLAALPVGPLVGCYLWLDRCRARAAHLLAGSAVGLLRGDGAGAAGSRGSVGSSSPSPTGGASSSSRRCPRIPAGLFPPAALLAPRRAGRCPGRHRHAGMVGIKLRLHRE